MKKDRYGSSPGSNSDISQKIGDLSKSPPKKYKKHKTKIEKSARSQS
jgi:hypothetical protein